MHLYIHAYIHTYIHAYIHTYIDTYIQTYIHTYIPTYIYKNIMHKIDEFVNKSIEISTKEHGRLFSISYTDTTDSGSLRSPIMTVLASLALKDRQFTTHTLQIKPLGPG